MLDDIIVSTDTLRYGGSGSVSQPSPTNPKRKLALIAFAGGLFNSLLLGIPVLLLLLPNVGSSSIPGWQSLAVMFLLAVNFLSLLAIAIVLKKLAFKRVLALTILAGLLIFMLSGFMVALGLLLKVSFLDPASGLYSLLVVPLLYSASFVLTDWLLGEVWQRSKALSLVIFIGLVIGISAASSLATMAWSEDFQQQKQSESNQEYTGAGFTPYVPSYLPAGHEAGRRRLDTRGFFELEIKGFADVAETKNSEQFSTLLNPPQVCASMSAYDKIVFGEQSTSSDDQHLPCKLYATTKDGLQIWGPTGEEDIRQIFALFTVKNDVLIIMRFDDVNVHEFNAATDLPEVVRILESLKPYTQADYQADDTY